jgi:hypothetical protein
MRVFEGIVNAVWLLAGIVMTLIAIDFLLDIGVVIINSDKWYVVYLIKTYFILGAVIVDLSIYKEFF